MSRKPIVPLILLAGVGCAAAYHPDGAMGGYSEMQFEKRAWVVQFACRTKARGNSLPIRRH